MFNPNTNSANLNNNQHSKLDEILVIEADGIL